MRKVWLPVLAILLLCVGTFAGVLAILVQPAQIANTPPALPTSTPQIANTAPARLPTQTPVLAIVLATALHIRSGPGTRYTVIGWLRAGDRVEITACRAGWAHVTGGWVNSSYLSDNCETQHENE